MSFQSVKISKVKIKNNLIFVDVFNLNESYKDIIYANIYNIIYIPQVDDIVSLYKDGDFLDKKFMFCCPFIQQDDISDLKNGEVEIRSKNAKIQMLLDKVNIITTTKINLEVNNTNISENISKEREEDIKRVDEVLKVFNAIKNITELLSAKPVIELAVATITVSKVASASLKSELDDTFN
jgi:hypothetical protein